MHKKLLLLGTALSLSCAAAANANERHGWYVGLEGGWVHVNDTDLLAWSYSEIQFENRWGVIGTVGHAFNGNWRMELEVGYRNNDVHQITFSAPVGPLVEGELSEWTGFFNALYNQPVGKRWSIDFGAGVGVDAVRYSDIVGGAGNEANDAVFAAQGILGLSYRVGPHWDVMLNYRYLWANDPEFTNVGGETDTMDMTKHTVTLGFRWGYDDVAAPPPPPVAPPPPPVAPVRAKQFIIFFGFDKCDITAEADRVLGEAADTAKAEGSAKVQIVGHTDTSGSPAYNQRLSECRSGAAKSNLVGKGIPDAAISTSGKGEGDLMVKTDDGVKEPQNRRATIDLQ
ncbi:MAG: OmpA family protein [Micropepsaceae bacterium]